MCYYISADNARSHQRTSPMHKKAAAIRCGQGLPENLRTNALRKSLGFCPLKGIHSKGESTGLRNTRSLGKRRKEGRKEGRTDWFWERETFFRKSPLPQRYPSPFKARP